MSDFFSDPLEYELARRAEELADRFFDHALTEAEAEELKTIWIRLPQTKKMVRKQFFSERLLRLNNDFQKTASPQLMEELKTAALVRQGEVLPLPWNNDSYVDLGNVDFQELSRLASESPVLPRRSVKSRSETEDCSAPSILVAHATTAQGNNISKNIEWKFRHTLLLLFVTLIASFAIYNEFKVSTDSVPKQTSYHPVATVSAALDIDWSSGATPLKAGQELEPGKIAFLSGFLELTLSNDVRLALEGPAEFTLHSPMRSFCGRGRLSVEVREKGKGFEVATPLLSVVDLGTEFSLIVEDDSVETHVINGKIQLNRLPQDKEDLDDGKALRIDGHGKQERLKADTMTYRSKKEVERKVAERQQVFLDRWRREQNHWDRDPSLLIHFDFEESGATVQNLALTGRQSVASASLVGPRRIAGRWRNTGGVEFRKSTDAIAFDLSRTLSSSTFFMSVRIDSLARYNNTLLASGEYHEGALFWQIRHDGSLQVFLHGSGNEPPQRYGTPPIITRKQWGAWYTLAVVVDTEWGTLVHYFEGEKVAELPLVGKTIVELRRATLGNSLAKGDKKTDVSLDGGIEQFLLFDRALGSEEIRRLHLGCSESDLENKESAETMTERQ